MLVSEQQYRSSLTQLIRGAVTLLVLYLAGGLLPNLPGMTNTIMLRSGTELGTLPYGVQLAALVRAGLGIVAAVIAIRLLPPARNVANVAVVSTLRLATLRDRSAYELHATQVSSRVTSLLALVVCYIFLDTPLRIFSWASTGGAQLYNVGIWVAAIAAVVIAFAVWRSLQPLLGLASQQMGDAAAAATVGKIYTTCATCGTSNDKAATFCAKCGNRLVSDAQLGQGN